jgi:DNA modification methylase
MSRDAYIYFEDKHTQLWHGRAEDVLPLLGLFDLLLTDPAYGIRADRDRHSQKSGWVDYGSTGWDNERTNFELLTACIAKAKRAIVWGGNFFPLSPRGGWLVWDKLQRDFSLSDCELAWTSENRASRVFSYSRALALQDGKRHPTQKPLALMKWCIGQMMPVASIVDCFAGVGTTAVAAKAFDIHCTLIEREVRYCALTVERLAQQPLPFEPPAVEATAVPTGLFELYEKGE